MGRLGGGDKTLQQTQDELRGGTERLAAIMPRGPLEEHGGLFGLVPGLATSVLQPQDGEPEGKPIYDMYIANV